VDFVWRGIRGGGGEGEHRGDRNKHNTGPRTEDVGRGANGGGMVFLTSHNGVGGGHWGVPRPELLGGVLSAFTPGGLWGGTGGKLRPWVGGHGWLITSGRCTGRPCFVRWSGKPNQRPDNPQRTLNPGPQAECGGAADPGGPGPSSNPGGRGLEIANHQGDGEPTTAVRSFPPGCRQREPGGGQFPAGRNVPKNPRGGIRESFDERGYRAPGPGAGPGSGRPRASLPGHVKLG